jgi:hypothetical protein
MNRVLRVLGLLALLATVGPSVLYLAGSMELASAQRWMLAATVAWFMLQGLAVYRSKENG